MAEDETLGRPYARAVFELARDAGVLPAWSERLAAAARVAENPQFKELIDNPRLTVADVAQVLLDILGDRLDDAGRNLIRVLADNHRLAVLPTLAALYEDYRAAAEGTVEAQLISAYPVEETERHRITAALKARLGREIHLECAIDARLLGGAVVRAGDLVIDGSVRGKLEQLGISLSHS
ncbi:MAG: F0F1 ATP synthase subunit delta [Chromatiales bacterium 21-64-14]|nr:MAG: F0F1 ATP synthase subunit delta [Chromatiales bacterium 21-64-14]HQU16240.1 F0F1 ATP synthase subunit delta [Gammaproteobacteria bacterium]